MNPEYLEPIHPVGRAGGIVARGGLYLGVRASVNVGDLYEAMNPIDLNCGAVGSWDSWVCLAREIIAADKRHIFMRKLAYKEMCRKNKKAHR